MAISDRQDDGHRASVDHDPQSRQYDGQLSIHEASPAVARAAATFTALPDQAPDALPDEGLSEAKPGSSRQAWLIRELRSIRLWPPGRTASRCALPGGTRDVGGNNISCVGDTDALLTAVGKQQPDLAIIDVRMPPAHRDEG